jgi:monoamine oxidase
MNSQYDVIVIGGGFAGVTAARNLRQQGHTVLILEARDRLGGRTWTTKFGSSTVDFGGTWVHWFQPHVWAELTRYQLPVVESPWPERCAWIASNGAHDAPLEEFESRLDEAIRTFCADAHEVLPRPHDPLYNRAAVEELDSLSVADRLVSMDLDLEIRAILDGQLASMSGCPNREAGLVPLALKWFALSGWDTRRMWDCMARYKIVGGTRALLSAMIADSAPDVRLSTPVAHITHGPHRVDVVTRSEEAFTCRELIVTVPLNTLGDLDIQPRLSDPKQAFAEAGQASRGMKVWVRAKGRVTPSSCVAPDNYGLTWLQTEGTVDNGASTLLVGFGPSGRDLDPNDLKAVRAAVNAMFPEIEVEAAAGHSWVDDEFSKGMHPVLRPGQLSQYLEDLQRPEGRVCLAGSETANGWNGFIDGAIESGHRASRHVGTRLS